MVARVFAGSDDAKTLLELDKIDLLRVGENGDGLIGQDDVGHPRPLAFAYRRRPTPGRGLGGEVGQERAVAERFERMGPLVHYR